MILSNKQILHEIRRENIKISGLTGDEEPDKAPFNTTAVDLKLSSKIYIPKKNALAVDLRNEKLKVTELLESNCEPISLHEKTPFILNTGDFILATTKEEVEFPIDRKPFFAARIEGKSSNARCGLTVHCTAPTIHAGFKGPITLEISNLSTWPFLLHPNMYICQLIIEEVNGDIEKKISQFHGQNSATGKSLYQDQDQNQEQIEQIVERMLKKYTEQEKMKVKPRKK